MQLDTGPKWAKFSRKGQGKTFVKFVNVCRSSPNYASNMKRI